MTNYPIADWLRSQINPQLMASVASGQVSPDSTIGQAILAQNPLPSMAQAGAGAGVTPPVAGMAMPTGTQNGQAPTLNPSLASLPNYPQPPVRPANLGSNAGQGYNNFAAKVNTPPQPLQTQPQTQPQTQQPASNPSLNQIMGQHTTSSQQNLLDKMLKAFGVQGGLAGIGQGIGGAINGLGQNISHGLDGIFHPQAAAGGAQPTSGAQPANGGQTQDLNQMTGGPTPNWQIAGAPQATSGQMADLTKLTGGATPNWTLDTGAFGGLFS